MGSAQTEAERLLRSESRMQYQNLGAIPDAPTGLARIYVSGQEVADALMKLLEPHNTIGEKIESKIFPKQGVLGDDGLFVLAPAEVFNAARAVLPPLETKSR
jgi:hypothetical protein